MGKNSKKNAKSKSSTSSSTVSADNTSGNNPSPPPPRDHNVEGGSRFATRPGIPRAQAPVTPGRKAMIRGLVTRNDLNGMEVTIQNVLDNGRIAVEVVCGRDTVAESREVVAIKRENFRNTMESHR